MKSIHLIQTGEAYSYVEDGDSVVFLIPPGLHKHIGELMSIDSKDDLKRAVERVVETVSTGLEIELPESALVEIEKQILGQYYVRDVRRDEFTRRLLGTLIELTSPVEVTPVFSNSEARVVLKERLNTDGLEKLDLWITQETPNIQTYTKHFPYWELPLFSRNLPVDSELCEEAEKRDIIIHVHTPTYEIISSPLSEFNPVRTRGIIRRSGMKSLTLRIPHGRFSPELIKRIRERIGPDNHSIMTTRVLTHLVLDESIDTDFLEEMEEVEVESEERGLHETVIIGSPIDLLQQLVERRDVLSFAVERDILNVVTRQEVDLGRVERQEILELVEDLLRTTTYGILLSEVSGEIRSLPTPFVYAKGSIILTPSIIKAKSWMGVADGLVFVVGDELQVWGEAEVIIDDLDEGWEDFMPLFEEKGTPLVSSEVTSFFTKRVIIKIRPVRMKYRGTCLDRRTRND